MPPERGNSAASSAYVSAPHSVTAPPSTQLSRNSGTSSTRCAIAAGVRKMPLPIVEPTTMATALHRPRRRGSRSPQRSSGVGVDMRPHNIHFGPHDATLRAARLGRRRLHLPPHHPRRHRADHGVGDGLRRPLAAVQRAPAPPARPPHADRVRAPTGGCARHDPRRGDSGLRVVAAAGCGEQDAGHVSRPDRLLPSTALDRPRPPGCVGVPRARVTPRSGRVGGGDREAGAAAVDGHPPPRHRDAATRRADRGGTGVQTDPGLAPGVSGPRARLRHRVVRRPDGEPGRGERLPRIPALQRAARSRWQLPAARPLDPSAARLHAVRIHPVVGRAHEAALGVGRGRPGGPPDRGRRRDGPARAAAASAGRPRSRGRGGVGGAGARGRMSIFPSPRALVRLWPRIRPHRWRLLVATVCLTASAAIGLAFPQIVRYLLDAAFVRHDGALLDRIALGLVGLFTIQGLLNFSQAYLLSSAGERVIARLRQDLFEHLVRLPPGFFAERRTGELVSRLSADIGTMQGLVSYQISEFARQVLYFLGGVTLLTLTHPELTRTTLLVVPVVVGAAVFFGRRLRKISTGVQDKIAEATAVAEEAFTQIRTVQSFVQEAWEGARYGRKMADVVRAALRRALVRGVFVGVITFALFSGVAVVLWQGGRLVLAGVLTAGTLVSFLLYSVFIAAAVGALTSLFSSYQETVGAARRVFELLDTQPAISDPPDPRPLPQPVRGDVALDDVSFQYQPELPLALEHVSLRLAPGEVVALVGPSGAGKTTLANLLPRFWDVTSGRITLDGVDIRALRLADLRHSIGIVPQEPVLFSGPVAENIAYGRPDASPAEIEAAARAAHAHEFVERLPQGYATLVGERGVKLSGGQRQRIAIARALLKDPAVLILDEATSSLDAESERLIEAALEPLLKSRTTLIIAHRLSTVRRADRLVVLDRGRAVEEGTHDELLALGRLYARLYQRQFRDEAVPV